MPASNIHTKATELGFDICGIARARMLEEREDELRQWADSPRRGKLSYMERNIDKRLDPALLMEGARSVVVCGAGYNRGVQRWKEICGEARCDGEENASRCGGETDGGGEAGCDGETDGGGEAGCSGEVASRIASYALSRDYHLSLKEKMRLLLEFIEEQYPGSRGRVFVDSAPILEKAWAVEAGLGWIGRNSLLINPRLGSFIMLGIIVTDALLPYDAPFRETGSEGGGGASGGGSDAADGCGRCRACIDACPVGAIGEDRMIDASQCISALTIENGSFSMDGSGGAAKSGDGVAKSSDADLHGWIFGCDTCQNVCPCNRRAPVSKNPIFTIKPEFAMSRDEWLAMDEATFMERFGDTPLERAGWEVLRCRVENI